MAKPGRRKVIASEFKRSVLARVRFAREQAGYDVPQMCDLLTARIGRRISPDSYRKWETKSFISHDAINAFCDITKRHPFWLFDLKSFEELGKPPTPFRQRSAA